MIPAQADIQTFVQALVDGWQPVADTVGKGAREALTAITWTGRNAAKRMIKDLTKDIVARLHVLPRSSGGSHDCSCSGGLGFIGVRRLGLGPASGDVHAFLTISICASGLLEGFL